MALATPAPRVIADYVASTKVANLALIAGGAAFVGLSAQVIIPLPFTPVPLTLQTFAVLLVGAALGSWRGMASMVLYAAVGTAGVPWFSGGSSGWGGASYGYILGFILAAASVAPLTGNILYAFLPPSMIVLRGEFDAVFMKLAAILIVDGKIVRVFHASLLTLFTSSSCTSQKLSTPLPELIDRNEEWEIERILQDKFERLK